MIFLEREIRSLFDWNEMLRPGWGDSVKKLEQLLLQWETLKNETIRPNTISGTESGKLTTDKNYYLDSA